MSKRQAEKSAAHVAAWQTAAMENVKNRHKGADRKGQMYLAAYVWRPFTAYLDAAALTREVTRSGYLRRAVAVAVAHDLGIDVRTILLHSVDPVVTWSSARVHKPEGGFAPQRDHGVGIESWCPHPGCDGSHLC